MKLRVCMVAANETSFNVQLRRLFASVAKALRSTGKELTKLRNLLLTKLRNLLLHLWSLDCLPKQTHYFPPCGLEGHSPHSKVTTGVHHCSP